MQKHRSLFQVLIVSILFLGLNAWAGMQEQHTVPLPDDDPAHKVAASVPQSAPATAVKPQADTGAAPGSPGPAGFAGPGGMAPPDDGWKQSTKVSGVKMDFRSVISLKDITIKRGPLPVSLNEIASTEMVEGQQAVFQFRFTDSTGTPMTGLRMAAWLDQAQNEKSADDRACHAKIQSFLQMQLSARPEVDLNTYYLLALTEEPSILIIDPRVGFGSSKLYAIIDVPAPGADWVQSRSGDRIYVSMPSINKVAVIDSMNFRLIASVSAGGRPGRMLIQPDGKYLWVGTDSAEDRKQPGVTVMDTSTLEEAAHIATGNGHHEIAFDGSQNAYVTNRDDGTVSIINSARLAKLKDLSVGEGPVAIAYSERAKSIYVANQGDGKVAIISAETQTVTGTMAEQPGLAALMLTPDGRWGFVANREQDRVSLFDVSSNRFVQKYAVGKSPDSLSLTTAYVYVRSRQSEHVTLIPLSGVGSSSHTAEFPAGQNPPVAASLLASPIIPSLDGDSAFIANPADKRIYFYQEGMAAPMTSMEGYGKTPTAVMLLDRSIHETAPGIYSVGLRLPKPGLYDVPVFVDSPSMFHCFDFTIQVNPLLKKKALDTLSLSALNNNLQVKPGEPVQVQFRLTDPETGKPRGGIKDVNVTLLLSEGFRQQHLAAEDVGGGTYQFGFTPPQEGVYYAMVQVPSLKVRANQLPYIMIRAREPENSKTAPEEAPR
jgi:YVTN family beta-propeller protein